jgi:hypothetical protein
MMPLLKPSQRSGARKWRRQVQQRGAVAFVLGVFVVALPGCDRQQNVSTASVDTLPANEALPVSVPAEAGSKGIANTAQPSETFKLRRYQLQIEPSELLAL